jgi:serralysin
MPHPVGYSFVSSAKLTGNAQVNSLLYGTYWMANSWSTGTFTTPLTYSFVTADSRFAINYSSDSEYESIYLLTSAQQNAIVSALGTWSSIANLKFTRVSESSTNVGDLRFGGYLDMDEDTAAWGYFPAHTPSAGDVWIGPVTNDPTPVKGTYDYLTFMHEIGHALGLKHPFSQSLSNPTVLAPQFDDVRYTIMSYDSAYSYEPTTPMLLDIAAIQSLYGANTQWQTGNNTYSWAADQSVFETIWDAGGNDTIDATNQLAAVRINLNEGQFSKIGQAFIDLDTQAAFNEGLAIAYGAKIENAVGSANDDTLIGNALNNLLNGRAGKDLMIGGAGNDTYVVDNSGDVVQESSALNSGIDSVVSSINYILGSNLENLTLSGTGNLDGTGNALNNRITGNAGANTLSGGAGSDTLDGGSGIDTLIGGTGNDTYVVDNISDLISETSTLVSEVDTVRSSVNWTLGSNLENLTLIGSASLNGTGNTLGNVLVGNAGSNLLNGGGGIDTLIGGTGNDTYVVDNLRDIVRETSTLASEIDTVRSSVSWTLGANLENLALTGAAHLSGTGNALRNVLTGNAGNNVLNAGAGNDTLDGGSGIDTLIGGTGNDTYVVDNLRDIVRETSTLAREIDTVRSSVSWSLGANLENLTLIGTAHLSGSGNALNNVLMGNVGNNLLSGGTGIDTLIGGTGNDTYVVDNLRDVVRETSTLASEIDTVRSSVSWTLGANLENLILTGAAHLSGTGNALRNVLNGNAGNNVLNAGAGNDSLNGGSGIDTLIGGTGNDTYVVDNLRDVVRETSTLASEIDTVRSSVSWSLGANLENLTLIGSTHLNGTGNTLGNVLIGNVGNNVLNGGAGNDTLDGGSGIDTLIGGTGKDTYVVDNLRDIVRETSTTVSEIDTVRSSVSWSLGANLENLTLIGSTHLNGNGNTLGNVLIGNVGNNVLNGGAGNDTLDGGSGIDTLIGGTGNDTYVVDNLRDIVIETSTTVSEIDTVRSSVSWSLGANLENLTLVGSTHLNGTGNALGNVLNGNTGNNVLNGGAGNDKLNGGAGDDTLIGGIGSDTLTGGTGADRFVFSALDELGKGSARDVITDFSSILGDKIDLSKLAADFLTTPINGFSFIDSNDFTSAGQLRFVDQVLYGNINDNLDADFEIQLLGVNTFSANDLIA